MSFSHPAGGKVAVYKWAAASHDNGAKVSVHSRHSKFVRLSLDLVSTEWSSSAAILRTVCWRMHRCVKVFPPRSAPEVRRGLGKEWGPPFLIGWLCKGNWLFAEYLLHFQLTVGRRQFTLAVGCQLISGRFFSIFRKQRVMRNVRRYNFCSKARTANANFAHRHFLDSDVRHLIARFRVRTFRVGRHLVLLNRNIFQLFRSLGRDFFTRFVRHYSGQRAAGRLESRAGLSRVFQFGLHRRLTFTYFIKLHFCHHTGAGTKTNFCAIKGRFVRANGHATAGGRSLENVGLRRFLLQVFAPALQ